VTYEDEQTPPIMDAWLRVPVQAVTPATIDLPGSWRGLEACVFANGNFLGVFPVIDDGSGDGQVTVDGLGLPATWVDKNGQRQASYMTFGIAYPGHRFQLLPLEGGNPAGTAQGSVSRRVQGFLRLVDSYLPLVDGVRVKDDREVADPMDLLANRVTGDRRVTEMGYHRGAQLEVSMDLPLRVEVSAIFGPTASNSV
jgi:hypothetical protein